MPNQFIRKPDAEYLRIDFESDWPAAAKRAAAGTLSSLDTTVRQEAFGFQVLAGADYALTEHTSVGRDGALGPIRPYHRRGDLGSYPQSCARCRRTASPHSTPRSDSMVSATWR